VTAAEDYFIGVNYNAAGGEKYHPWLPSGSRALRDGGSPW